MCSLKEQILVNVSRSKVCSFLLFIKKLQNFYSPDFTAVLKCYAIATNIYVAK